MKATCGGCPAEWYGLNIAHCAGCHETFSTIQHFDSHRSQQGERGRCLDPAGLKVGGEGKYAGEPLLRRNRRGFWVSARERPEYLNKAVA